jgi:nucleoside 2-deoxyribosyltransferase
MSVYIAASFAYEDKAKTSQRKDLIEKTVKKIKRHLKDNYYLPHQLKIPNAWDISLEEWSKAVYDHDIEALENADIVIFLSFGKENNAGSAWELGYVHGFNMHEQVHFPKTDIVVKMTDEPESLMISNSVDRIITEAEIDTYDWKMHPKYKTSLGKLS